MKMPSILLLCLPKSVLQKRRKMKETERADIRVGQGKTL